MMLIMYVYYFIDRKTAPKSGINLDTLKLDQFGAIGT